MGDRGNVKRRSLVAGARWCAVVCMLALLVTLGSGAGMARAAGQTKGAAAFAAGMAAAKAGQYRDAAHDFEQALLQGHTDPNTFYQLGLAYSKLKDWNDAAWALATAASDSTFSASTPGVQSALSAATAAGGADAGPPATLRAVTMTPMQMTAEQRAFIESRNAMSALQGDGTFFVAPIFNSKITMANAQVLTTVAADLQNDSGTAVKFVFLSAIPAPYTSLAAYAHDLFTHLGLQRGVVVAITPKLASAYSDRLGAAEAQQIATAQLRGVGGQDPVALASAIARGVTRQADDADAASTRRSALIGAAFAILLVAMLGLAIWRIGWRDSTPGRRAVRPVATSVKPRAR